MMKIEVMDYVRATKGDRVVESTVMRHEDGYLYLNPFFGSNIRIDECDKIEILRKFRVCDER